MLILTMKARSAIRGFADQPQIPFGSGLRIATDSSDPGFLQLTLVSDPEPGDDVLNKDGVWVFLEPKAARLVTDQILDIRDPGSGADFYFTSQQEKPNSAR